MSTINVAGYNGIINNLQVLGTLTTGGFAPSGNLSVSGTLAVSGTTTTNGVLNSAGGFQQNGYVLGYLEAQNTSGQSIANQSLGTIQFPTINYNTFDSSILSVSGSGNTTFTNSSSSPIYVSITASMSANLTTNVTYINLWIVKSSTSVVFGIQAFPVVSPPGLNITSTSTLRLNAGENFKIQTYPTITGGGSITSGSGSSYPNTLTIKQVL